MKRGRTFFTKLVSFMAAIVMVIAMNTTIFAQSDLLNVTVEFIDAKDYSIYEVYELTIDPNQFSRQYMIPPNATSLIIKDKPTVMDATLQALTDSGLLGNTEVGWDQREIKDNGEIIGYETIGGFIDTILGLETQTSADSSTTVWRGYSWKYQIKYVESKLYATNNELIDGMVISWFYNYYEEPIPGHMK